MTRIPVAEAAVKKSISENALQQQVKELAELFGWKYYHTWKSFHSPAGFPDCCFVRGTRLVFAELKSEKGVVSPAQQEWLDALGQCAEVYTWRPDDFEKIVEILK